MICGLSTVVAFSGNAHREGFSGNADRVGFLVQTTEKPVGGASQPDRLRPSELYFNASGSSPNLTISLNSGSSFQSIVGFGGAITDSSAAVFSRLSPALQKEVVEALWGPSGQRYNMARLTIGATDFSETVYNYDEEAGDLSMTNFSVAHDEERIIPLVKHAQAASAGALQLISSPWSPPGWMKAWWPGSLAPKKGYMRNSAKPGLLPDPKVHAAYALYTSKYLSAYKAAGINISRVTVQNEPDSADHMFPVAYPACNFNGTEEGSFLRDFLGPRLRADHPDVAIYVHDGQKFHDVPILDRVNAIVKAAGEKFVDGVAFHWYGANLANYQYLAALYAAWPKLPLLATEATLKDPREQHVTTTPWKEAQKYAVDIIGDLNAGAEGWIEWNVLLDQTGGPTCIGTTQGHDCTPAAGHCDAPILANVDSQKLEYRDSFHVMAHFSRFLPRGAVRIGASASGGSGATPLNFTAARTPSGELVTVVLNTQTHAVDYRLSLGDGASVDLVIPPHALHTIRVPAAGSA